MIGADTRGGAGAQGAPTGSGFLAKLVLLVVAFLFAAAIAGGVTYYQTERTLDSARRESRDEQLITREWEGRVRYQEHVLSAQNRIFNELTTAIGTNLQAIAALSWSYDEKLGANDLSKRLEQYQRARAAWQTAEIRLRALIESYFGSAARDEFEFEIGRELDALGADVERIYINALRRAQSAEAPVSGETGLSLRARYKDLDLKVYTFLIRLLDTTIAEQRKYGVVPPDYAFTPPLPTALDQAPGQIE